MKTAVFMIPAGPAGKWLPARAPLGAILVKRGVACGIFQLDFSVRLSPGRAAGVLPPPAALADGAECVPVPGLPVLLRLGCP